MSGKLDPKEVEKLKLERYRTKLQELVYKRNNLQNEWHEIKDSIKSLKTFKEIQLCENRIKGLHDQTTKWVLEWKQWGIWRDPYYPDELQSELQNAVKETENFMQSLENAFDTLDQMLEQQEFDLHPKKDYGRTHLIQAEYNISIELQKHLKVKIIPHLSTIQWNSFGFTASWGKITEIGLYRRKINSLPTSFFKLTHLKKVSLAENHFSSLPNSIRNLKRLKTLWLQKNSLVSLPEAVGDLPSLQSLDLSNNKLRSALPDSFGNLTSLKTLDLSNNHLRSSPLPESFGNLINLQTLNLSNNQLTSPLPKSFGNLTSLEVLNLSNNRLSALPESFGQLKQLLNLDLRNNPIQNVPESFTNLHNLRVLTLVGSHLPNNQKKEISSVLTGCTIYW
ncbi:MAG: leucine-rich repeat domain-containing protein [Candidatus Hodarchaeota archaeon]